MQRSFSRWPLIGLLLLGSVLVLGEGCGTTIATCVTDEECGDGSFCNANAGTCQKECTSSADCPTDQTCFLRRGKCLGGNTCANKPARSVCVNGHVHTIDGCDFVGDRQADCGLQGCLDGKCLQAPIGCGDGICDPAQEHCLNCPFDCACPSGELCDTTTSACLTSANCGDGTCDPNENETCASCPIDCACPAGKRCDRNQQLCTDFPSCGNGTCEPNEGEDCSSCPFDCACPLGQRCVNNTCAPTNPCGDGQCSAAQGENCDTCPKDCACPADQSCKAGVCKADNTNPVRCGDQKCDKSESSASCCSDCGCPSGYKCENNACQAVQTVRCGNNRCEASENTQNCCTDCGCPSGNFCNNNRCCSCIANEERRCNGAQIEVCKADCTGWQTEQTCANNQTCKRNASGSLACVNICTDDCSTEGQKRCNGGYAIQTCLRSSQGCLVWTTTLSCKTNEYCESGGTTCKTSACTTHKCPALEATQCDVRTVQECQNDTSGCRVWKNTNYCAPPQTCSKGKCIYDCGGTTQCSLGAPYCSNNNVVQCETDANGCRKLVTKSTCSGGKICKNPTTGVAYCECSHKCATEGEKQCNTNMPQECRKNADGCREWVNLSYCTPPYTCSKGACIYGCSHTCELGAPHCSNNNVVQCETDANGCRKLVTKSTCSGGKICKNPTTGVAYCECSHKCTTEGEKQCNTNMPQECRKNAEGCREWVNLNYCTPPYTCSKGACVYNCNHTCELGAPHCSGGNVVQCEADSNGCRRLVTKDTCGSRQTCKNPTTGVAYCECSHGCSSGAKQCNTNTPQECRADGDGCRYWANLSYCAPPYTCSGGACIYNCNHTCSLGPVYCSGGNVVQCEADSNGCRRVVTKDTCGSRQTCKSPTTGVAYCECSNACSSGAKQCSGNTPQECRADGDGCRYWANLAACGSNQSCSGGNCINNCTDQCSSGKRCNGNTVEECRTASSGCKTWQGINYCTPPTTCSNGNCVIVCNHQCSSGAKQCNGNTPQECRTDGNGCRYWANLSACGTGYACSGGNCVATCSHSCSYVGQKQCAGSTPSYVQECKLGTNGCRYWSTTNFCSPPQRCVNLACTY